MQVGDRVKITSSKQPHFFKVGDKATLTHQDEDGEWWADFDTRDWGELVGPKGDSSFCIQESLATCTVIED